MLDSTHISVNFPDDKTYTAVLQAPNVIKWSNNSSWTKVPAIETVIDLNGRWMSGGVLGPVITVHGNSISIDMSALKRPTAVGTVVNSSDISVNFPDDKTYSGVLQTTRDDPLVEQLDLDEVRNVGRSSICSCW